MPMPHRTQMQVIKRRLKGKDGSARIQELRDILGELPGIYQGPYGKIRQWVEDEIGQTNIRRMVRHTDSIAVRKEGHVQVAVVGLPNAGKSSLLRALSGVQTAVGAYPFTTLKPVPALIDIGGIQVQLVEVPGLVEGANEDRGGGRALLGIIRSADFCIVLHDPIEGKDGLAMILREIEEAGIDTPRLLILTKSDLAGRPEAVSPIVQAFPAWPCLAVSSETGTGLRELTSTVVGISRLIRVYPKTGAEVASTPMVLAEGATVLQFAAAVHHDFARLFKGARVWGPSARFPGQPAGAEHVLKEGDEVELKRV